MHFNFSTKVRVRTSIVLLETSWYYCSSRVIGTITLGRLWYLAKFSYEQAEFGLADKIKLGIVLDSYEFGSIPNETWTLIRPYWRSLRTFCNFLTRSKLLVQYYRTLTRLNWSTNLSFSTYWTSLESNLWSGESSKLLSAYIDYFKSSTA